MRRCFLTLALAGFLVTGCSGAYESRAQYEPEPSYDYDNDYDDGPQFGMFAELEVYGRWHHVSAYGWVWSPYVSSRWRPYYHGHWVWTDHGWMWVGYEPFAWAAYHYGYWTFYPRVGWIWIPDYEWAPSRVTWVVYDNYVSWAPLAPPHVHIGYPWAPTRVNVWVTVRADRFTEPNVARHTVRPKFKREYAAQGASFKEPNVRTVERFKGSPLRKLDVDVVKTHKGKHEVTRVKLPPEQSRIVEQHRVPVRKEMKGRSPRVKEPKAKEKTKEREEKKKGRGRY